MSIIKYVIFGMIKYVGMIFDNISKRDRCGLLVLNCDVVYISHYHGNVCSTCKYFFLSLPFWPEGRVCDRRGVFNNQVFKIDILASVARQHVQKCERLDYTRLDSTRRYNIMYDNDVIVACTFITYFKLAFLLFSHEFYKSSKIRTAS